MRFFWLLQIGAILLAPPAVFAWRHRADRGRALGGAALVLTGVYALFFGAFAVGETFADPGGWRAAAWTAAWLVPLGALSLLAWRRPDRASWVLGLLLLGLLGVWVWSAVTPEPWHAFEDERGPVRALMGFALTLPAALLGRTRPLPAGAMLIAVAVLPMLVVVGSAARGLGAVGWPVALVTAPAAIVGVLLLAASVSRRSPEPAHHGP